MTNTGNKARYIVMKGFLEYARLFPDNMDSNPEFHPTGQYNMNFYPETDAEADKFFDAGIQRKFRGADRLKPAKDGSAGYGCGKFIRLKRDNVHRIEELGGAPEVVYWDDENLGKPWTMAGDGALGNGTYAIVKVVVYGEGDRAGSRLEKVGIIDHVPYDSDGSSRF